MGTKVVQANKETLDGSGFRNFFVKLCFRFSMFLIPSVLIGGPVSQSVSSVQFSLIFEPGRVKRCWIFNPLRIIGEKPNKPYLGRCD